MPVELKPFETLYPADSRFAELEKVVSYIKEGNSSQVIGLPGVGRSNLLGLLAYNKHVREKHFPTKAQFVHFIPVNFAEIRNRPLMDAMKFLFLNLVDSLRFRTIEEIHTKASGMFKESLSFNDELVLVQGLKRVTDYLAVEKKLTLIFLFDRFEEYIPMLTPEFFANLRVLRNLAKYRFSIVFSLNKPLEDVLEPALLSDYHEFIAGHTVYLPISDEPSVAFRLQYLERLTGNSLTPEQKEQILSLTAGHGKLTRLAAEAIFANDVILNEMKNLKDKEILRDAQDDKLATFLLQQKPIRGALLEIIRSLSPVEQKYLLSFPHLFEPEPQSRRPTPLPQGAREIIVPSPSRGEGQDEGEKKAQDDEVREYFENIGLVKENKIAIPLLVAYLASEKEKLQEEKQYIVFDEEKNVIRKGETVLSEGLTAAEFRLLAHLLHNPKRVIDRDEVISVVWQDAKSTAGVTDQAVDQLIFRLRRKIEENPNQPRHLVTVKGRGFSFTP